MIADILGTAFAAIIVIVVAGRILRLRAFGYFLLSVLIGAFIAMTVVERTVGRGAGMLAISAGIIVLLVIGMLAKATTGPAIEQRRRNRLAKKLDNERRARAIAQDDNQVTGT
ncbi:MAG: hypothetical protein R3D89_06690 [Sphingomonadaceae bacterium]